MQPIFLYILLERCEQFADNKKLNECLLQELNKITSLNTSLQMTNTVLSVIKEKLQITQKTVGTIQ